jgi:hypothetical protein
MKFLTPIAAALALAWVGAADAQTGQTVGVYRLPGGSTNIPATGVQTIPPANLAPFQTTVTTATGPATLLAAARAKRQFVTVINSGTTAVYLGGASVTASTGVMLPGVAGASITIAFTGDLYAVAATGSQAVTGYEVY